MKRNYGIDLLRMILMYMIVILHVLGHGGILRAADHGTANYYLAWTMESICYCAVNCYALITGYVYYGRKQKLSGILSIWVQTLFYSAGISLIVWIISPDSIGFGNILGAFFPISRKHYWYVSAYAGLFLLMPLLNIAVKSLSAAYAKRFMLAGSFLFTILPTFLLEDPFALNGGYSTLWLAFMYLTGAFIRKFSLETMWSKRKNTIVFWICALSTAAYKFIIKLIPMLANADTNVADILYAYNSPTIFLASIALFLCFVQIEVPKSVTSVIHRLAPAAFGVYLVHCHAYISDALHNSAAFLAECAPLIMVFGVVFLAAVIYVICMSIDLLRIWLFKTLHLNTLLDKVSFEVDSEEIIR